MSWIVAAFASALFAGVVAILSKLGVCSTDSDVATALRTVVVTVFAWAAAGIAGSLGTLPSLTATNWLFLILSGTATGASWLAYFKALSLGDVNKVTPIDKSSAVLASLLAIVLFGETAHLPIKLACIAVILIGTFMMIERKDVKEKSKTGWLLFAMLAAVFAALTSVLGKIGIGGVESNLGTAIRTTVVLIMAWGIVLGRGKASLLSRTDKHELVFLALSGVATGASWLLYYYAIQTGIVSVVVQIDKLSVLFSIAFARIVLGERLTRKSALGLTLLICGTLVMTAWA